MRHSVRDGISFSIMAGAGESYFSAFAIFLRVATAQVGMLVTLPPLIASLFQLFSVWLGRRIKSRKSIVVAGALMQASALVPLAIMPFLFPNYAFVLLLLFVTLYFIGPNLGSPQWGSLMGDIVPERHRGRFFALRTRLSSIASFSALIGAGLTLQFFDNAGITYWGFVTIFGVASIFRLVSAWHLHKMKDPGRSVAAPTAGSPLTLFARIWGSPFWRFSFFFACMQFAVAISGPYIAVHMLRDLDFSYIAYTINSAASVITQFVLLNRWGRLGDLFGNRLILVVTGFTIPFIPSLWILSSNYTYLLLVQVLSGVVWSGFTLSATNFVYDLTAPHKRATYMAIHGAVAATAVFLGASLGGFLATILPTSITVFGYTAHWEHVLFGVFFTATIVRLAVAVIFLPRLEEVRRVRKMTVNGLIFRVARFNNLSGLVFDPVVRFRKRGSQE